MQQIRAADKILKKFGSLDLVVLNMEHTLR